MLGLFLGASVFTIIDFIRYAVNYTYVEYKTRFQDMKSLRASFTKRSSRKKPNTGQANGSSATDKNPPERPDELEVPSDSQGCDSRAWKKKRKRKQ